MYRRHPLGQRLLQAEEQGQRKLYHCEKARRHARLFLRSKIWVPFPIWSLMLLQENIVRSTVLPRRHLSATHLFSSTLFPVPASLIPSRNSLYPSRSVSGSSV